MCGIGHIGYRGRGSVDGNSMGIVRHDRSVEAQSSSTVIFVPQHLLGHFVKAAEVPSERVVSVPDNARSQEFSDPGGIVRVFEARVERSEPLSVGMFGHCYPPYLRLLRRVDGTCPFRNDRLLGRSFGRICTSRQVLYRAWQTPLPRHVEVVMEGGKCRWQLRNRRPTI